MEPDLPDVLYHKHNNIEYLHCAKGVAKTIENDDIRLHRFTQMGLKDTYKVLRQYEKIKALSEKIIEDGCPPKPDRIDGKIDSVSYR